MFKCFLCDKEYMSLRMLKVHFQRQHVYNHVCPICNTKFKRLKDHLKAHFLRVQNWNKNCINEFIIMHALAYILTTFSFRIKNRLLYEQLINTYLSAPKTAPQKTRGR